MRSHSIKSYSYAKKPPVILFSILIILIFTLITLHYPDNMYNKIFCGYQGWFGADNDDPVNDINWFHWCINGTEPSPDTVTFDIWPDYSEYDKKTLFYSNAYDWKYKNGERAGFFSSVIEETVLLHCKWMRDYGIDGVFVQRFIKRLSKSEEHRERMDIVLRALLKGGKKFGIKVAVMYDITSMPITRISQTLIEDWIHLVDDLNITSHPSYQRHPDNTGQNLPVVGIWGFGFIGEGVRGQARLVAGFFNNHITGIYHATMLGGVPAFWRTQVRDSKPEYKEIYELFDIICPWIVGRVKNSEAVADWSNMIKDDLQKTSENGQGYMPVCFPGFSIYNMARNRHVKPAAYNRAIQVYGDLDSVSNYQPLNKIPRMGGNFMWSQFYHWRRSGTNMLYVAMFDEVDESTAIFKLAPEEELATCPEIFLHLNTDGFDLRSDHFLWITGTVGFLISQGIDIPEIQPDRFPENSFMIIRIEGKVTIISTIKNAGRSYAELFRKTDTEDNYTMLKRFELKGKEFSEIYHADDTADIKKDYTYIIVVYFKDGSVRSVSDKKRTNFPVDF